MKKYMILFLLLGACAPAQDPNDVKATKVETFATDEVKLISSSISDLLAPGTYQSDEYTISGESRLLLRLGSLKSLAGEILDEQPVLVRISPLAGDWDRAFQNLMLCPLETNWMMHATWSRAHSFPGGFWKTPGADIIRDSCLTAVPVDSPIYAQPEEARFCDSSRSFCFDIKPHLKAFVRSRGINNGWALVNFSGEPVQVLGDRGLLGPEVFYRRMR